MKKRNQNMIIYKSARGQSTSVPTMCVDAHTEISTFVSSKFFYLVVITSNIHALHVNNTMCMKRIFLFYPK